MLLLVVLLVIYFGNFILWMFVRFWGKGNIYGSEIKWINEICMCYFGSNVENE